MDRIIYFIVLLLSIFLSEQVLGQGFVIYKKDGTTIEYPCTEIDSLISVQGIIIYKKGGTKIEYPYSEVDSIVGYPDSSLSSDIIAVDLGLPSGTKWANMNVGASSAEDYGDYYAWGETESKSNYSWSTYMVTSSSDTGTSNDPIYVAGFADIAGSQFDVATAKWGGLWKMPTSTQFDELLSNCTWTWTTQNGVNGYKVEGSNGNSIFLPATGSCSGSSLNNVGSFGQYWSTRRKRAYYVFFSRRYSRRYILFDFQFEQVGTNLR